MPPLEPRGEEGSGPGTLRDIYESRGKRMRGEEDEIWRLSPAAARWVARVAGEEGRDPGRVISQIIESYLELEEEKGRESVERLRRLIAAGPGKMLEVLEGETREWGELRQKIEDLAEATKIYMSQLVCEKMMDENGEPKFRVSEEEKEILFGGDE